ncbi:hypothetical protein ACR8AL_02530 [Clavibacter sepedonicus]|uniref:Membrane protein n=1 Tax=Clavibacter sepedonicus TaxID=31964 RepID=B0RGV5_CLASE|nr:MULTISPECIES: hypothetical protein [Clavibacter]MBD5381865.1 hypothetical protein [Clavibacter sp.]OQJ47019.1 conserved secretedl protein [Clavibacter sepedonicus]OQJ55207.1 conserved secretedl protein [Clavibacter sepedonicus]UUK66555.1 hypothetical protein LRE50_04870 [Clavibacter sepedonicus]CAQ01289.1 putative membrane protein [Clavibacter sepedonicus]
MTTPSPDARFRQTTPAPRPVRLAGLVIAVGGLVALVATGGTAVGVILAVLLVAAGAVVGALRIRITLDPGEVEVALVPLKRIRMPYSAVADCTVVDHLRPRTVGGIGVRSLPGGGAAILLDAGPAVAIEGADGTRHLVRSTFPREAATRIRDRAAAAPLAPPADDDDPEDPAATTA